jgi:hypothetical protein
LTPRSKSKLFLWIISFLCENPVNREKSVWNEKNRKKTFFLTFDDNVDNNKQQKKQEQSVVSNISSFVFLLWFWIVDFSWHQIFISSNGDTRIIPFYFHKLFLFWLYICTYICTLFSTTYMYTCNNSFQSKSSISKE